MNGWFLLGGLAGIALTILAEVVVVVMFGLPRDGVELDDPAPEVPASEVVARFTNHVRVVPSADVIDLRDRQPAPSPVDAGYVTFGQALGVVLVAAAFLALLGLVGAVETAGL